MERFSFIITVYKTKYYGYSLILVVMAFNTIFNYIIMKIRFRSVKSAEKQRHEIFNINRE